MSHGNLIERRSLTFILQVFSPAKVIFAGVGVLLSVRIFLNTFAQADLISGISRQLRMFGQAKRLSLTSSNTEFFLTP